ncbi:MAG TPA: flagellar export chaperone FliS [Kofleriaceae bacterium]|nr:flagellar export chaperone FliS [Kofleriaceae bacterium]
MSSSALKAYRRNDLQTAPKTDILDRLFVRLEADLRAGQSAITAGDIAGRARALDHASRILTELIAALDTRAAPELCGNLEALYRYCQSSIGRASVERKAVLLDQSLKIVTTLRVSFAEAAAIRA